MGHLRAQINGLKMNPIVNALHRRDLYTHQANTFRVEANHVGSRIKSTISHTGVSKHTPCWSTAVKHQVVIPMFAADTDTIACNSYLCDWIVEYPCLQYPRFPTITRNGKLAKGVSLPGRLQKIAGTRREPANGGGEVAHA